jgi:hypothetical protein
MPNPLLLAAGQLSGTMPQTVGDPERARKLRHPCPVRVTAAQRYRENDVFPGRQRGHQVECLEHKADAFPAQQRDGLVVQRAEVRLAQQDLPRGEAVKAGQAVQQG